jgi:NAD(P)-dependent dehydrogenase (short-subunit alcohol dehydrogenase family)
MSNVDLSGRTCLVTGASSGIGEETALGLARRGARVVLLCRSAERAEASRQRIVAASGNEAIEVQLADLASLDDVRRVAASIAAGLPALHVLVNNAGTVQLRRETSVDGFETTFAVNHLAPFLLTRLLLPLVRESRPARIVNVASHGHRFGRLDLDDLQSTRGYSAMRVYGASKLANVLFSDELARRLDGSGVTSNCLHPGAVGTRLGSTSLLGRVAMGVLKPFILTPAQGARTSIWAATAPELEGVSGRYFAKCREARRSQHARDPLLAAALWKASSELTGLADQA